VPLASVLDWDHGRALDCHRVHLNWPGDGAGPHLPGRRIQKLIQAKVQGKDITAPVDEVPLRRVAGRKK
jgi:hypothetical protein